MKYIITLFVLFFASTANGQTELGSNLKPIGAIYQNQPALRFNTNTYAYTYVFRTKLNNQDALLFPVLRGGVFNYGYGGLYVTATMIFFDNKTNVSKSATIFKTDIKQLKPNDRQRGNLNYKVKSKDKDYNFYILFDAAPVDDESQKSVLAYLDLAIKDFDNAMKTYVEITSTVTSQISQDTSSIQIQNEIEKQEPRINEIIKTAELHFNQGDNLIKTNKRFEAKQEFNAAVDVILNAGIDIRANPRLNKYYYELIERIYRIEVPQYASPSDKGQYPPIGFNSNDFVVSGDELAKIKLSEKKQEPSKPTYDRSKDTISISTLPIVTQTQKPVASSCKLEKKDLPEIRGLILGQTKSEIFARWSRVIYKPKFSVGNTDDVQIVSYIFTYGGQTEAIDKDMQGISSLYLHFFEENLMFIGLDYIEYEPNNIQDFIKQAANALKLPTVGWTFPYKNLGEARLVCKDFQIDIGTGKSSQRQDYPYLQITDLTAKAEINNRIAQKEKAEREKELEKQRKKKVFKP